VLAENKQVRVFFNFNFKNASIRTLRTLELLELSKKSFKLARKISVCFGVSIFILIYLLPLGSLRCRGNNLINFFLVLPFFWLLGQG
jgi:hypothetical protein